MPLAYFGFESSRVHHFLNTNFVQFAETSIEIDLSQRVIPVIRL
jgi:hypothetical protein